MKIMERNSVLAACIISLIIIVSSYVFLIGAGDNETLRIKTIKGDLSALNNVVVKGVLQDRYHGLRFTIDNGRISKEFKYYDEYSDIIPQKMNIASNTINNDGLQYSYNLESKVAPDANKDITEEPSDSNRNSVSKGDPLAEDFMERVTRADKIKLYANISASIYNYVRVDTGVIKESKSKDFIFKETYRQGDTASGGGTVNQSSSAILPVFSNSSYAFTFLNDKLFFTVLSDKTASGKNGIFRIDEWVTWPNWEKKAENGKTEKITEFSLKGHNTEVLGLTNVCSKLVLILMEDNKLVFRAYDPETGKIADELKLTQYDWKNQMSSYQIFTQNDTVILASTGNTYSIVSVKLGKTFSMEQNVESLDLEGENMPGYFPNIETADNKLFVFCNTTNKSDNDTSENLRPQHFMMYVYDKARPYSKLLFKGELVSDADQDREYDRQIVKRQYTYGYWDYEYREFNGVHVESRKAGE
jgi:hypothetical protein